jgi:quercetin dioxygenase-like cupin family protein
MNVNRLAALLLLVCAPAMAAPPEETVAPLVRHALTGIEGKAFTAIVVTFPPGAKAIPHRHGTAFLYAYVLEGTVRSQLEGEPVQTYTVGQSWIEEPGAHHLATENASATAVARLLVTFVADEGAALKTPDP